MIKYEKEFSFYIVNQIFELFSRLCGEESIIPQYRMICNFESNVGINQYVFENYQYKDCTPGIKVRTDYDNYTENGFDKTTEDFLFDMEYKHEIVIYNNFNNCNFTIIFDIMHIPYETFFFNHFIFAYFRVKKIVMQKLLKSPDEYMNETNFVDYRNRSIFSGLLCGYEIESIISQAVTDYFYFCYGIDINLIASLSCEVYEGISNKCGVYIPRKYVGRGKRSGGLTIKLNEKVDFCSHEVRRIRKYMEIATEQLNMVLDINRKIVGYTSKPPNKYEGKLVINGKLNWRFSIRNYEVVFCTGVYRIINKNNIEKPKINLHNIPFTLTNRQKETVSKIMCKTQEQNHGTTIVFGNSRQIKEETKRLTFYNRCIQISPINLIKNMDIILNITSIDGAILVDFNGNCYAIGAIFDGDMEIKGNIERGARYNSTVNYIERQKRKGRELLAIIFSEDRKIDVYPESWTPVEI